MYARCVNTDFPQTVNTHSAEIPENMKKFQKPSTIQIGLVTQKVSQGISETQKSTNQKKEAIGANGHKESRNQKLLREISPQWSRQFCSRINP
jgi:hypothetical protein